jgi:hypothetical protein
VKLTDKFARVVDRYTQTTNIKRVGKIELHPEGCKLTSCHKNCKEKLWFFDADANYSFWCVKKSKSATLEEYLLDQL